MTQYHIYINDTIGWPISAAYVRQELAGQKGKPCDVYISSLGGDVATALQIRQLFAEHGEVTAHLHGFVASAATIIATGAKTVKMGEFALFMIHKCSAWQEQWGQMNADDIAAAIDKLTTAKNALDSIDQVIGSIYAQRTGKDIADLVDMMKAETWLSASEAKQQGFVDEIISDKQQEMTADIKQRILACGYPVPQVETEKPSLWQRISDYIDEKARRIAAEVDEHSKRNIQPIKFHNMKKTPTAILALLALESIVASEDGNVTLTEEQVEKIEEALDGIKKELDAVKTEKENLASQVTNLQTKVTDLTASNEALTTTNADLTSQIAALQKADGDDTTKIEAGGAADDHKSYAARARADYEKVKSMLA
ncbi:MAG: ATP-dependent Clp protease proteolytic subunit [Bacteroidaceae bacterium]|nr:ATP-dependent Clp protease proteolytic subunit [Bacteroidaceae bacterium]